jgi:hypothetical protein
MRLHIQSDITSAQRKGTQRAPFLSEIGRVTLTIPIEPVEFNVVVVKVFIDHVLNLPLELPARRRRLFILEQIENPQASAVHHALKNLSLQLLFQAAITHEWSLPILWHNPV